MKRIVWSGLLVLVAVLGMGGLSGAASAQTPAAAVPPATQPAAAAAPEAPATQPPATNAAPTKQDDDYIIGPGDTLNVFVWRNPELSVTVPVRPDGKISTPLVEDMVAVGKTPSQLARDIEKVLAEYIRTPSVNVIVTNATSKFSQVKAIGQVVKPQSIPYREGLKVLDVILDVGGMTEFAAGNRAKLIRKVNGKTKEIKLRLDDLVNKGDMSQNLDVKPGDVLVVPESLF